MANTYNFTSTGKLVNVVYINKCCLIRNYTKQINTPCGQNMDVVRVVILTLKNVRWNSKCLDNVAFNIQLRNLKLHMV